jgi:hypothetical protein
MVMNGLTTKQLNLNRFIQAVNFRNEALQNGDKREFVNQSIIIHSLSGMIPKHYRKLAKLP